MKVYRAGMSVVLWREGVTRNYPATLIVSIARLLEVGCYTKSSCHGLSVRYWLKFKEIVLVSGTY